jgi:hypothetical protein
MSIRRENDVTFLDQADSTGAWIAKIATDFGNIVFSVGTALSANLTIKFQWSISINKPDFDASKTVNNIWNNIQVIDLEDGASVSWETGFSVSWTDAVRHFEANVSGMRWINVQVTSRSAGSVTVKWYLFSND